ncbi:hypothetical protein JCM33374_g6619 [Metschnikowia sp. JCM 33374]|nr:hypothetical protein JCM33374_g6619 [Metschnikowia sp. JCM 33374]
MDVFCQTLLKVMNGTEICHNVSGVDSGGLNPAIGNLDTGMDINLRNKPTGDLETSFGGTEQIPSFFNPFLFHELHSYSSFDSTKDDKPVFSDKASRDSCDEFYNHTFGSSPSHEDEISSMILANTCSDVRSGSSGTSNTSERKTPEISPRSAILTNPSAPRMVTETSSSEEVQKAFFKLFPLLQSIYAGNFEDFMTRVLKEYHDTTPLGGLYNLIYNDASPDDIPPHIMQEFRDLNSSIISTKGLHLCHLMLEIFKHPEKFDAGILQSPHLKKIDSHLLQKQLKKSNLHELSRNCLAIKIILASLQQVNNPQKTILRISLFKLYYIICQKLIYKYHTDSVSFDDQQNIIVGQSKLGKLTKLVFPNLRSKRLGKRGESKSNLIGFRWNESVVDEETRSLLTLDIPHIREHFMNSRNKAGYKQKRRMQARQLLAKQTIMPTSQHRPGFVPLAKKPLYSYVEVSSRYPRLEFSPRVWGAEFNSVPEPSLWAKCSMERSVGVLKTHGVDLSGLITYIGAGVFASDEKNIIGSSMFTAMDILVSRGSKTVLSISLKAFLGNIETEVANWACVDKKNFRNFTKILRKMIHLNEMTSSVVKPTYARTVLSEMANDSRIQMIKVDSANQLSDLESMIVRVVMMAANAYNFRLAEDGPTCDQDSINIVLKMAKNIAEEIMVSTTLIEFVSRQSDVRPDVAYQVFRLYVISFHKIIMTSRELAQAPIPVIHSLIEQYTQRIQNVRFHKFGKSDPVVCTETFRSWWVYSSMFQEYISVISEVVALREALSK